jgi:hypothetical protein
MICKPPDFGATLIRDACELRGRDCRPVQDQRFAAVGVVVGMASEQASRRA